MPAIVQRVNYYETCCRSAHHAVLVCVDGTRLSLEAVEPDGTVFDRFEPTT
jgi:hypothetical protein